MNRRRFLRLAAAMAGAGLGTLGCSAPRLPLPPTPAPPIGSAIVIGAGAAGLTAARALRRANYQVIILEGRDRLGGRIWTSEAWEGAPVDLGASQIYGLTDNPISALADEAGVRRAIIRRDQRITYGADGVPLSAARQQDLAALRQQIEAALAQAAQSGGDDLSVAQAAAALITPENQADALFILNMLIEQEQGGDIAEISAARSDEAERFSGDDVLFPDGYGLVFEPFASKMDVRLSHTVTQIAHDSAGVIVTTSQGEIRADAAVVTLPLGVLKRGAVQFTPALPPAKQAAIDALGVGVQNRLALRFDRAFWPDAYDWVEQISERPGQWARWANLHRHTEIPILVGLTSASFGREAEGWGDAAIVESAMASLRALFGSEAPAPIAFQLSRWGADPLSSGATSFYHVGGGPNLRAALAEPVDQRLFFAGEATSAEHPSTVHGAHLSGLRAAAELVASARG